MKSPSTILVLQHAECESPYLIGDVLTKRGFVLKTLRPDLGDVVPWNLDEIAGLVVMGGPQSVYEMDRFPYLEAEMRLIKSAVNANRPVLGICLGSQLMAAALGARVYKGSRREIGWHQIRLADEAKTDFLWKGVPSEFEGFHWHGDVFDLPVGAARLASSDITPNQAFVFGEKAYGFLFHLEVTRDAVLGMIGAFPEEVADAGADARLIESDTSKHLLELERIGRTVFGRWADLL